MTVVCTKINLGWKGLTVGGGTDTVCDLPCLHASGAGGCVDHMMTTGGALAQS